MKIAVDAMGGDFGPAVVVEGAAAAAREFGAVVTLVGDKAAIEREVARVGAGTLGLEIRHASQVVSMGESPSQALRRKRDSSLRIAAHLRRALKPSPKSPTRDARCRRGTGSRSGRSRRVAR